MTNLTFFVDYLLSNFNLYLLSLGISTIIYGYITKQMVKSIIDPIFYAMISNIFANSVPIFLFFMSEISFSMFSYIVLSEISFWSAYFIARKKHTNFSQYSFSSLPVEQLIFYSSLILCVSCYLLTYVLFGIPLFKTSRLETFQNANGLGILSYLQNFAQFYCIIYSYYLISTHKKLAIAYISIFLIFIFCLLSGSKSSILIFIFCYFFYRFYYKHKPFNLRKNIKLIIPIITFPIIVITLQSGADFKSALLSIIMRFVGNGDCYWMAYPNDIIDKVEINNQLEYLFSRMLAPFRLINYSDIELPIGVQIDWEVYPSEYGITKGPNTRLPILGWVLFKWWGLVLSFIFGLIFAFWHTRLLQYFPKGIISVIIYGYIYTSLVSMLTDPLLSTGYVFNFFLFGSFLYSSFILFGGRFLKINKHHGT